MRPKQSNWLQCESSVAVHRKLTCVQTGFEHNSRENFGSFPNMWTVGSAEMLLCTHCTSCGSAQTLLIRHYNCLQVLVVVLPDNKQFQYIAKKPAMKPHSSHVPAVSSNLIGHAAPSHTKPFFPIRKQVYGNAAASPGSLHGVHIDQLLAPLLAGHHALERGRVADLLRHQRLPPVLLLARLGRLALLAQLLQAGNSREAPVSGPASECMAAHQARDTQMPAALIKTVLCSPFTNKPHWSL